MGNGCGRRTEQFCVDMDTVLWVGEELTGGKGGDGYLKGEEVMKDEVF